MSTQHTPAPWRTSSQSPLILKADSGCDDVVGESRELIGSMHSAADAAFVLKCVNAHDGLLEALREIADMVVYAPEGGHEEVDQCVRIARAAIAKATGSAA